MSCNWPEARLGDHIDSCLGKMLDKKKNKGTPQPYLGNSNVRWGTFELDDLAEMRFEESEFERYRLKKGDLVVCEGGEPGRCAIWEDEAEEMKIQKALHRVRPKENLDNYYLYYWFLYAGKTRTLEPYFTGTTIKHLTGKALSELPIRIPPMEVQLRCAEVLKSLDRKISQNTRINQTLEEMVQAIFKSWFVDFDPVKAKINGEQPEGMDAATASLFPEKLVESELGLIPEGWEVGDLSDLMDFNPKRTLKKGTIAPYLDMKNMPTSGHLALDIYDREMGSGTKFKNGDSLLARITPCLENGKTAYVDFLEDEQVGWGSTEYIVMRSKSDSYKYFSYYMARFEPFRKFAIQSMTGTSGRQRAQAQTVQTMPFAIPPISILEKFNEFVAPNMQMIKSHGSENRTLAALRDTLLPKLLSGEIDLDTQEVKCE
ncbi:restriction endonuclease subunit S [Vibrio ostreicida]|uniref:restriction endonuclease subunit S n=1 Tax=Vibrio ostreicida TaxID=526588 RepID=UPI0009703086|nr:restriction endonuclease subunit S [Vibrio ostreicida]